jgi:hypothetical protein
MSTPKNQRTDDRCGAVIVPASEGQPDVCQAVQTHGARHVRGMTHPYLCPSRARCLR